MLSGGVEENLVRMISLLCFTIVGWGALTDIGASLTSLRMVLAERKSWRKHTLSWKT